MYLIIKFPTTLWFINHSLLYKYKIVKTYVQEIKKPSNSNSLFFPNILLMQEVGNINIKNRQILLSISRWNIGLQDNKLYKNKQLTAINQPTNSMIHVKLDNTAINVIKQ